MAQGNETKFSSFDEFYNKYYNLDGYKHHYDEFYEAGAASRQDEVSKLQTEIDELKSVITKQQIQILQIQQSCSGCDYRDLLIDELQKKIDGALVKIQDDCMEYGISDSLELQSHDRSSW